MTTRALLRAGSVTAAAARSDSRVIGPTHPSRWALWLESPSLAYAAAGVLAAVGLAHVAEFYHDDAFISLRYASRLLAGAGLTWNPGERVEGFTHPLWLAQITVLGAMGVDLPTASRALGVAYLAGLFALWRFVGAAPLLLVLLATQPALLQWSVGGLETTSFCFWLVLGAWLAEKAARSARATDDPAWGHAAAAGAALSAAALTRPEGLGAGLVAVALLAATRRWRAMTAALTSFAVLGGSYELFRILYFGEWLPNTAYAKLGGHGIAVMVAGGVSYLRDTASVWLPAMAAATVAGVLARGRRPLGMIVIALPVLLSLLLAGGDHMPGARLVVPLVVVATFVAGVAGCDGFRHRAAVTVMVLGAAGVQLVALVATSIERDPAALVGEQVGRFLESHLPAGALVATATAGSTTYFAPSLRFIDTLGLNDRWIAHRPAAAPITRWQSVPGHAKGDGGYVLERAPDVILLGPAQGDLGTDPTRWFLTDFELLHAPEFHARYRPYRFLAPVPAEFAERRPLRDRVGGRAALVVLAYMRADSPAAASLEPSGTLLATPPLR